MRTQFDQDLLARIDMQRLPKHIAVIMDGNGRWAAKRLLHRSAGHKAGRETLHDITEACRRLGIEVLTVYAFSTENWRRSSEEVGFLMRMFVDTLKKEVATMNENDIRLGFLGSREGLPEGVLAELDKGLASTASNSSMTLNLAINYGGRDEILRAAKNMMEQVKAGTLDPADVDEKMFSAALDTNTQPDPDLLIRPSGELRLSNFLLWQAAYSEFCFMDKMWPDFTPNDLLQAIIQFQQRDRRFGGRK